MIQLKIINQKKLGFTLLELLVVISIMAVLMALAVVSYSTAQKKGRDAKRRSDLKQIQNAYEQYVSINNGIYPASVTCDPTALSSILQGGAFPTDPKNVSPYVYTYTGCGVDGYCVCVQLESGGGNSGAACSFSGATHFCVKNLQ